MNAGGALPVELTDVYLAGARRDIEVLERGLEDARADPARWPGVRQRLREVTHNIKGQGTSFGYPLMTRIGQSLSDLLKAAEEGEPGSLRLAGAHVAAMRAVLDHDIVGEGGEPGRALVGRLEALVGKLS
ncbi:MAG: Hpt domain-containing protein [Kiloniellaceae bacterium]